MYISELNLENYRVFKEKIKIEFNEGINVLIGQNNSGKTTLINALSILFDHSSSKSMSINDFSKNITIAELKEKPPEIKITAILEESEAEENYSDDLVTVSDWLIDLESPYKAKITYHYYLPEKELENYLEEINNLSSSNPNDYWQLIESKFLRKYKYNRYVGNPDHKNRLDSSDLKKFDFQFLSPIRDVERDLYSGSKTLLKEVIDFFMDYDIKTDNDLSDREKKEEIRKNKNKFNQDTKPLLKQLHQRMEAGKEEILKYADKTGASFDGSKPEFAGELLDTEMYSALKLMIEDKTGIQIPADQNGLGYNNLIYISLLLAKMQKDASGDYLGSNAKIYSILAIEEPEAHLHPNMQYLFLKFLNDNQEDEVRQIFISSHSPNITAAVDLDDLIVLNKNDISVKISYPGRVFSQKEDDQDSKKYIERFLDVTKSDMFFAEALIFVEGISESLLVPEFAKQMDKDLIDKHISIVNLGGRHFKHFLKLFDLEKNDAALNKKVACITDLDPVRRKNEENAKWKSCNPFAVNNDDQFEYKECSNATVDKYSESDGNIRIYTQEKGKSSTFEYDLLLSNPCNKDLITESMSNQDEIEKIMELAESDSSIDDILEVMNKNKFKKKLKKDLVNSNLEADELRKHIIAGRFLDSTSKAVVAQELAFKLISDDLEIKIPDYIKEAIKWIYPEP
ncbi:putative ATP-dependent endonuclease of OLD family [Halanaerobium congolense]|uniref:Putative ATP-dependent endonuclease of OLD family n=1 Tax=Halanaerobium congolense TaxID=54121 RepID=A0A4R8GKQ6_9FIRM|nr:AAA family ATPase [Halanaerobium congolense]TDX42931.1 putative ATP-dependent endonuclease of OLD family [Halanaerobium congolense]